jgi:hypothetical protein
MKKILIFAFMIFSAHKNVNAQDATPTAVPSPNRVWTLDEIIKEKSPRIPKGKVQYCHGGRFQPCVCAEYVAREMKYRPAVEECKGNAGVFLKNKYTSVFSVVVRDSENRDRWPVSGFGNCTPYERDTLALNKCSAFKTQDTILAKDDKNFYALNCLGASGYSKLFKNVTRVTAKLSDKSTSNQDPLARWCLVKPNLPLN